MYDAAARAATGAAAVGTGLAFTGLNATFDIGIALALVATGLVVLFILTWLRHSH